jgi:hypothetical protein
MQSDRTIQAGDKSYVIRFGQNALYLLEQELTKLQTQGVLKPRKFSKTDEKTGATIELDLPIDVADLAQLPRRVGAQVGLYAGLEGGRLKYKTRPQPFTVEEAGEIIDAAGGFQNVEAAVIESFKAAFPQYFPEEEKSEGNSSKSEGKSETPEKNEKEEPASTGTRSSSRRSKSV